ncbi:MAG TPA: MazG family protein [Acidimicrobiales bacterium]|jgi:tetrapyrrole methylase family protein/MazG family protein|nr:MazG family protein [Acidimicrobiales bacterium]
MPSAEVPPPRIDVVGLGPAGPELITTEALALMEDTPALLLRTRRHPAADRFPTADSFDHHYEAAGTFEVVYRSIVDDLVTVALRQGAVVYAVPGSPSVAEATVDLLRHHRSVIDGSLTLSVHPSVSFLDLAFDRLGIDPVAASVRVVDGETFAVDAAGERGPLLVAQCWNRTVLSDIKLSVETAPLGPVTLLHHLGLDDEQVVAVGWDALERSLEPDHLTSLWIPHLAEPVAGELVQLDELVHTLRARCPWDRRQTHGSLARHLMEESYEVLEAIDAVAAVDSATDGGAVDAATEERAVAHLEEELGDLLFQVYFHSTLAAEAGRFTLADVARGVHDKLVDRHPHVFGDVSADTPEEVATNWEARKLVEKGRSSVTEGIPAALPALALATKLQRKALAVGMVLPSVAAEAVRVADGVARLQRDSEAGPRGDGGTHSGVSDGEGGGADPAARLGELLFSVANVARELGVDPETALRARAATFRKSVEAQG